MVKSDIRRLLPHDFLLAGFTSQTSRANNKLSVTDMNRSLIELVQTLVSDDIGQATKKFGPECSGVIIRVYDSGVNDKPVCSFSFVLVQITKFAKNIWAPVIENVIILGHLMANILSRQRIYIFCEICHIFTLY